MVLKTFTHTKPNNVCFANNREFWKRVVEIQQTKLNSHYKQIKTSECWKPWQEGSKSNAANYSLWVENYIFCKSSSQNAHPLIWTHLRPRPSLLVTGLVIFVQSSLSPHKFKGKYLHALTLHSQKLFLLLLHLYHFTIPHFRLLFSVSFSAWICKMHFQHHFIPFRSRCVCLSAAVEMSLADQKMRGREMVEEQRKIFQLKINLVCLAARGLQSG